MNHGPIKARPLDRNINISEVKSEITPDEILDKGVSKIES